MASRLDRLVSLLETGSTPLIRNTAAQQLADVQKAHPDELFNLLTRVIPYIKSKSWDTRIAAAKAIGGIVENAEKFDPNADDDDDMKIEPSDQVKLETTAIIPDDVLQLDNLDIKSILLYGHKLLGNASKGDDYSLAGLDPADRLAVLRKRLPGRLGLLGRYVEDDAVDSKELASRMSLPPKLDTSVSLIKNNGSQDFSPMDGVMQTPIDESGDSGLSKRQLNQLKRKAKLSAKTQSSKVRVVDISGGGRRGSVDFTPTTPHPGEPFPVKQEGDEDEKDKDKVKDYFTLSRPETGEDDSKINFEFKGPVVPAKSAFQTDEEEQGVEWPYQKLCEFLMIDIFDPVWEVRHGACMGLREIVKVHGGGAGRRYGKTRAENDELNRIWLEDIGSRICCIFMLDRFGDYISDNVVAPIRETAAQTFGVIVLHFAERSVRSAYKVLHTLVMQDTLDIPMPIWEVCQGGMLGLKYLVAVRNDMLVTDNALLDGVVGAAMKGLANHDDDVRAVSAATLIPITNDVIVLRPADVSSLVTIVWDCLSDLKDDLSASTGAVMDLLAKLCQSKLGLDAMVSNADDPEQSFKSLVPRLYPFLRHTITTVRSAVLNTLGTFLGIQTAEGITWIDARLLRLLFQNLLTERNEAVLDLSLTSFVKFVNALAEASPAIFASTFSPSFEPLLRLTLHPIGVSRNPIHMDQSLFIRPSGQLFAPLPTNGRSHTPSADNGKRKRRSEVKETADMTHNVDADMMKGDVDLAGMETLMRSRLFSARAMGRSLYLWSLSNPSDDTFERQVATSLKQAPYATSQFVAAVTMEEFGLHYNRDLSQEMNGIAKTFSKALQSVIDQERPPTYRELVSFMHILRSQCHSLLNTFRDVARVQQSKIPYIAVVVQGDADAGPESFSVRHAEKILGDDYKKLVRGLPPSQRLLASQPLEDALKSAEVALTEVKTMKEQLDTRVIAASAAALVALKSLPKKPSGLIKGIMDSVKREENFEIQKRSAAAIAYLVQQFTESGRQGPAEKILINLVKFCCIDTSETPEFHLNVNFQDNILSLRKEEDRKDYSDPAKAAAFAKETRDAKIIRRGAKEALENVAERFGSSLLEKLPAFKSIIENPLREALSGKLPESINDVNSTLGQDVVDALSTIRAVVPKLDPLTHPFILDLLPLIITALQSKLSVLRYAAAKCFATICSVITVKGITMLVEKVLPSVNNAVDLHHRQGAVECVYHLIHAMGDAILPYVIFLIVPILGRMSDSDNDIRLLATTSFATLIKLVPLEAGIPDPPGLPEELLKGREKERKFMSQMLDARKVEPFEIPVAIKAELRSYQQEGVNWLAFLNKYHLHGILCDDMGLGKTLQTLCIVASDHHMRSERYAETKAPEDRPLPSLIVCPPTLSGHWLQEIKTYAPFLTCMAYVGPPAERARLRPQLGTTDIVITSYEICRNDVDILVPRNWNYCVLDEGHLIKNPKAKTTIAVKRLASEHRLILSGTPIQNNVLELWSLFDFLMPGFLGTEKVFLDRFAKPIANSRFSKASSKEQEAGALAIEALHKQVLPFLLRRLKEEVLDDLPPKILQNYYCDLSDLQRKLFEDFQKKEGKKLAEKASVGDKESKQHIFQALQYMRKLCNSPALVIKPEHKLYSETQKALAAQGTSLSDPIHAPKLIALRDLLIDCGIGGAPTTEANLAETNFVSQHRALIFCQMKEMLDIVQNDVLKAMLPSVQFMRLDGSVEANKRQNIVNQFNTDPSYDVLLLTTSVGGLGLNLTGADTVIFVEHDWNPQKDLQAMDRAHRIGQKKVVNVYRLITRGTLEEKIMNLQRFKIDVASTVVNQQNNSLATMETDQILDLFNISTSGADTTALENPDGQEEDMVDIDGEVREKGKKGFLDGLDELWDESQYKEEYNLEGFLKGMKV